MNRKTKETMLRAEEMTGNQVQNCTYHKKDGINQEKEY